MGHPNDCVYPHNETLVVIPILEILASKSVEVANNVCEVMEEALARGQVAHSP